MVKHLNSGGLLLSSRYLFIKENKLHKSRHLWVLTDIKGEVEKNSFGFRLFVAF